jgi:glyoxalase/bleomycin resistance protein/dioxygenase superfamily protein
MLSETNGLAHTVRAMRPIVPARDFEVSKRFYIDLGFQPQTLTDRLVEMHIGSYSFILQDYYVEQWAHNFVMHVLVSNLAAWWDHIVALDLTSRYGVKTRAPQLEDWGLVAGVTDPSGALWRFAETVSANRE